MTKYESSIKYVPFAQQRVYDKLSDLNSLESLKENIPPDKIGNITYDADHVGFEIPSVGKVDLQVVERVPFKCVKFSSVESPLPFSLWIQIVSTDVEECKIRITAGLEVNMFMKGMIAKPVKEGLEKIVEVLSVIQY